MKSVVVIQSAIPPELQAMMVKAIVLLFGLLGTAASLLVLWVARRAVAGIRWWLTQEKTLEELLAFKLRVMGDGTEANPGEICARIEQAEEAARAASNALLRSETRIVELEAKIVVMDRTCIRLLGRTEKIRAREKDLIERLEFIEHLLKISKSQLPALKERAMRESLASPIPDAEISDGDLFQGVRPTFDGRADDTGRGRYHGPSASPSPPPQRLVVQEVSVKRKPTPYASTFKGAPVDELEVDPDEETG